MNEIAAKYRIVARKEAPSRIMASVFLGVLAWFATLWREKSPPAQSPGRRPVPANTAYPLNSQINANKPIMNLKNFIAVIVLFCLCWPSPSLAYEQKKALAGLMGVKVTVQYFDRALGTLLMPRDKLQEDIQKKMKKLGVPVFKESKPPAMSTLFVNLKILNAIDKGITVYYVSVLLMEWAFLKRKPGTAGDLMEVRAINWYDGRVGFVENRSIKNILKVTDELVYNFVYDYLAVNK